ncbi:nucleoid occlusion protein [Lactobacillus johnsonii]|uniref:Nucleoid occlusion protein n=1 Tax=Lactobacillus johnsonii TaxID=33959 RepID=A0A9W3Z2E7_LACJH|nr:nucleoid occlusion protein [Lactobacillus johnsonii]AZZ68211.1 nucleoid occlusion protein [Lactobacillus johnsonii]
MAFSLFGNRQKKIPESKQVQEIELDKIMPNRYQPRHTFSDESIEELATTLKEQGLLQPIILRKPADSPEGEYEIIAGERRFRAAQSLKWAKIPAIVEDMDDEKAASLALVENLQRENLNPIDEAQAYVQLMKVNNLTQTELAEQMGKTQSYIANKIRLLKLTPKVQGFLIDKKISQRHGRALLALNEEDQDTAVSEIIKSGLTVKETEEMVKDLDGYFAAQEKEKEEALEENKPEQTKKPKKKVQVRTANDFKVQINTIKKAIKMAKDSGMTVKYKEDKEGDSYKITIELLKK